MQVLNIHEREIPADAGAVGALIDSLASEQDALWPRTCWPPMRFDRPLGVGAVGGHGPIPYGVEEFQPSRLVKFRFAGPRGFHGCHWFEVLPENLFRLLRKGRSRSLQRSRSTLSNWPMTRLWPIFRAGLPATAWLGWSMPS